MKLFKRIIINLILALISVPLAVLFGTLGVVYTHIKMLVWLFRFGFKKTGVALNRYYWLIALSVDQTAGVICQHWFNDWMLIDSKKYPFGHPDKTISHITGVNYVNNNVRFIAKVVGKLLNFLDKKHVQNAAINDQFTDKK